MPRWIEQFASDGRLRVAICARVLFAWLLALAGVAALAWDLGFAAALGMTSAPFEAGALLTAWVAARRIAARPVRWTLLAVGGVTGAAILLVGPLAAFAVLLLIPAAGLFLFSMWLAPRDHPRARALR